MKNYIISEQQLQMIVGCLTDPRTVGPTGAIVQTIGMLQGLPEVATAQKQPGATPPTDPPSNGANGEAHPE